MNDHKIRIGTTQLMEEAGLTVPVSLHGTIFELESDTKTVVVVACDDVVLGAIAMADDLK